MTTLTPDYEKIAKDLFAFLWREAREGYDIDGAEVNEKLRALGLVEERPCDPAENEWDADRLYFPVDFITNEK